MGIKITPLISTLFPRDDFNLDELANVIENNRDFSTKNLEVKKDELGPQIIIKAEDEDGIINATKQLTKVYKQNPHLKSKIYSGLKLEENTDKLLTAYLASESELSTPEIDGERSFGHNLIADKILYKLREIDRKINRGITIEIKRSNKEKDKNYTLLDSIKKHKKAILTAITASALGSCIVYPSLIKGRITFDPYLTINHLTQTIQNINPILLNNFISNNLRYVAYTIPAFRVGGKDDEQKSSRRRRILKYGLLSLTAYEIGDVLLGLPGLVDLGEASYIAYNMHPSNAIYPWQWDWVRSLNLALKTNDLNSLTEMFTGNSDLLKLANYYHQASSLIPEDRIIYYTPEELDSIGYNLVNSLFADDKISKEEEDVLRNLMKWDRWWIVRDIINSGMIDDKNLKEDWDKDKLNNITEILQGTNPLNDLEIDPNNLSERYGIIGTPWGSWFNTKRILELYHTLKKNGYDDDHIILFLQNLYEDHKPDFTRKCIEDPLFPWLKGDLLNDFPVHVDLGSEKGEHMPRAKFLRFFTNLPSDENDEVLFCFIGHGNIDRITIGDPSIRYYELNKAINSMQYGRMTFIVNISYGGGFIANLNRPQPLKQVLAISSGSETESSGTGTLFLPPFIRYLENESSSIKNAFNYAADEIELHPTIYEYGINDSWPNYFSFLKYRKRD